MTQTLRVPAVALGASASGVDPVRVGSDSSGQLFFTFSTTNLVAHNDEIVLYEDEIVEYY